MNTTILTIFMGLCAPVTLLAYETEQRSFTAKELQHLTVKNGHGTVKITGSSGKTVEVSAEKIDFAASCTINYADTTTGLKIEVLQKGWKRLIEDCQLNIDVRVPANIDVKVQNGNGDVTIAGMNSAVDFRIGSGNLTVAGPVKELSGKSGSGHISASKLTGKSAVEMGAGSVQLSYDTLTDTSSVNVKTGTGDVEVTLPKGVLARTQFTSGIGKLRNDVDVVNAKKGMDVAVTSGTGNLHIKSM